MSYTDTVLTCRDCGEQFTWTPGEQEFYAKMGLQNPPARCNPCRETRKEVQSARSAKNANSRGGPQGGPRGGRPGDGREYRPVFSNYAGPRGGHGPGGPRPNAAPVPPGRAYGDRPPKQLFDAVCAECGQQTQVPFQPRGTRPVYCRACFDKRGRTF